MSAEYLSGSPEEITHDEFAINCFNEARSYRESLTDFLLTIQDRYEETSDGHLEISHMMRAARFINQEQAGSFSDETQAIFNGQLIASQLLNYIHPEKSPVSGLANAFVRVNLQRSQSAIDIDDRTIPNGLGTHTLKSIAETPEEQVTRVSNLASRLKLGLSSHTTSPMLSHSYEEFGKAVANELYSDTKLSALTMSGFRLILRQYNQSTELVRTIDEKFEAANQGHEVPTDETLIEITDLPNERGSLDKIAGIEDISDVRKSLLIAFQTERRKFDGIAVMTEEDNFAFMGACKAAIERFNAKYKLLGKEDILFINGELYAMAFDAEFGGGIIRYEKDTEIRGIFNGFSIVEVPTSQELNRAIARSRKGGMAFDNDDDDYEDYTLSPAIQIILPIGLTENEETSKTEVDYDDIEAVFDIPLIYKNVTFKRVKAVDLTPEPPLKLEQ